MGRRRPAPRRDAGRARGTPIVQAVLAGTLAELATSGLEALSVERVARRAKVNKTSVYRRWPTREALVTAALEGVLASVAAQVPDTGSLRGDLTALVRPVAELMGQRSGRALVQAALSDATASRVGALAARLLAGGPRGPLDALVARARKRGEWRATVSAEQLVFVLVGAVIHRAMLEHRPISGRWLSGLMDVVLFGVVPRSVRAATRRRRLRRRAP